MSTLDPDITRAPVTTPVLNITTPVLPLAVAGWTLRITVNTLDPISGTYRTIISTPGAVTVSEQIYAIITVPVDWRPPVLLSSGIIVAKIGWPLLSCCSGGEQCD